ncbi:MAG: DNA repair protein RecN, partial [Actinobacteria bacterium]|nr:DNA repair protein RecN [Actinomycetota bacterium]
MGSRKVVKSSLEEISIRSLGVIESSNIEFKSGLTVLTGETGAGKTMVLTALGLVLGNKSDSDLVRQGQERAVVTGKFTVPKELAAQIIDAGGEVEDESVVITRSVSAAGKSRVLVGGVVSSSSAVSSFASSLVEIHAQSSSSKLTKAGVARELLDRFAGLDLTAYQEVFDQYQQMQRRIIELKEQLSQADRQIAELSELANEFAKLNPKSGELAEIENEIEKLGSVEVINQAVSSALNLFENEDLSAVNLLQQIRKSLDQVNGKDKQLDQITERYTENLLNLQDISSDLTSYLSQLEADPNRFEKLQERKSSLNSLLKRYGTGSDKATAFEQLLLDGKSARERIADLSGGDQRVAELEKEAQTLFKSLQEQGLAISKSRKESGAKLSAQVTAEVRGLSMPNATFVLD